MTDEQRKQIEEDRREREEELLLLLLLLLGFSAQQAILDPDPLNRLRADLAERVPPEIAESMAEAHRSAFRVYGGTAAPPSLADLIQQYDAIARTATEAMIETISASILEVDDVLEGLRLAGYDVTHTQGIELGAERNIVTASNAGILDGAIYNPAAPRLNGLRHVTVQDDRTTAICNDRVNLQLPVDHPYWVTGGWPSLHWNCRSIIEPIYGSFTASTALPTVAPMPGFGIAPPTVVEALQRAARFKAA